MSLTFPIIFMTGKLVGLDFLRPKGGKYPGISSEVDRSLGDLQEMVEEQEEITDDFSFRSFDGKKILEEESTASQGVLHSIWMDVDEGRPPFTRKLCFDLPWIPHWTSTMGQSHDWLLCVHTFSIGGDHWDCSKSQIYQPSSGASFALRSLYATVICIEQKVSIAVLQCTSLKSAAQYLDRAPLNEISLPKSNYDVSGQILLLHPFSQGSPSSEMLSWVWNSRFVSLDAAVKSHTTQQGGTTTTRIHHISFPVNGCLVLPLYSHQFSSILVSDLPPGAAEDITAEKTWIITKNDLQEIKLGLLQ